LAVRRRQIDPREAQVHDLDAEFARLPVHAFLDAVHQFAAPRPDDVHGGRAGQHVAQGGVDEAAQASVGVLDIVDRLIEAQRVGDPVACESIDFQVLAVGRQDRLHRQVKVEHPLIDIVDVLDQRHLEVEARLGEDLAHRPEAQDERLLGLMNREHGREHRDGSDREKEKDTGPECLVSHRFPP